MHRPPFKKDITPFARGGKVIKHIGKGAREQSPRFGGRQSMTGGSPLDRMTNLYPKASAAPMQAPTPSPMPMPMGMPTMPSDNDGDELV